MTREPGTRSNDRGAILVQMAFALVALGATASLAVDYGVLWLSRTQAQNAADAAALAGATSLAFDNPTDKDRARSSARAAAASNRVWLEAPATATVDVEVGDEVPSFSSSPGPCVLLGLAPQFGIWTCVRASVYRDVRHGNALPTYFGHLVGVDQQGARAQATSLVVPANTSACVWPLAVPNRWSELNGTAGFQRYLYPTPGAPPTGTVPIPDSFTRASSVSPPGSGYSVNPTSATPTTSAFTLTPAVHTSPGWAAIVAQQFVPVQVPRTDGGGFSDNLTSCNGVPLSIGDTLPVNLTATMTTVTAGASARRAEDPTASWNATSRRIQNSCAASATPCAGFSPRLVLLPMFDVDQFDQTRWTDTPTIRIDNFIGFFLDTVSASSIQGDLATYPGSLIDGRPLISYYFFAFLRTAVLTR